MNAHALLTAQGWRGHGHSLHKSSDAIGLAKPLLLSRKANTQGLGIAQHFNNDQWWLSAFDEQLKGLEMTENGVKQTVTSGKLNTIEKGALGKWSVYASFVKGGFLDGTLSLLSTEPTTEDSSDESSNSSKSKTDKSEKAPATSEKKVKKETKEERRARKEAKRKRKEDRAKARAARQERREAKAKGLALPKSDDQREEKRRRREKKEEKRRKREKEGKSRKS